ncbi:MAG: glutamine synthetase family protein [Micrococcales bacterium]|nr:glutamine synthetase family protein [Micrococcales bacterium]
MTTTPLDAHREGNAAAGALDEIKAKIAESGVDYLYLQVVSVTGRVVGKVIPARHLERVATRGVQQHRTAAANLQTSREGNLMGGGIDAAEYTAIPDLDSFAVLPWDTSVARFFCRAYEPDHVSDDPGAIFPLDSRGLMKDLHADFTQRTGLELRTGCEPEMVWEGAGLEAIYRPESSPAYHIEHLERHRPIYQKVISYGQALGLDMIEGDYEDPGQLELNWMYDHSDLTADRLITYRQLCKQVARELGIQATFMPKVATGMMGNGCHHNFSLWRGDENVLEEKGRKELHLTDEGKHALGGVLAHTAGGMLIMGQTVNSYKRYWDAGQFAPSQINWGMDNKTCTVRLSANGRLEYKLPDAMVNPYLSHAFLIATIDEGLQRQADPGAPQVGSSYAGVSELFPPLPLTLGEAVDAFAKDDFLRGVFGDPMSDLLIEYKRDEWARFCGYVTDWERTMYWDEAP